MAGSARDPAGLLAAETGAGPDDHRPQVGGECPLGLQRAMIDYVRGRIGSGDDLGGLAADVLNPYCRGLRAAGARPGWRYPARP